jgi:hypothetical protein
MLALVRAVAANWNLRRPLKIPQADHPSTFFAAKTADTFIQLNADHPDPLTLSSPQAVALRKELEGALVDEGPREDKKHSYRHAQ